MTNESGEDGEASRIISTWGTLVSAGTAHKENNEIGGREALWKGKQEVRLGPFKLKFCAFLLLG